MADNKKYYYLKLKDNFFDSDEIRVLESMQNGYKYSNLLLKLYLRSLKMNGQLRLNEFIPYNTEMIAAITSMDIDTVRSALELFKQLKLIDVLDDGTIYMLEIQNFIGESSTEADRKRRYRMEIEEKKQPSLLSGQMSGQMSDKCPDKNPPEIEIEIEIEKENIYSSVIDHLNDVVGTKYKHTSKKTQSLIKARQNEGYNLEDFIKVIDIKSKEWLNTEYSKYLRPETLFGTKFENYLNQGVKKNDSSTKNNETGKGKTGRFNNYNFS